MKIVVDTNIIFSALLSPDGKFGDIIINSEEIFDFWAPTYLKTELTRHQEKLLKISGLTTDELTFLKDYILRNINFIDVKLLPRDIRFQAVELCKDIDEYDIPFVSLAIGLKCKLWSGDKKLISGLKSKGSDIVIDTNAITDLRGFN